MKTKIIKEAWDKLPKLDRWKAIAVAESLLILLLLWMLIT